MRIIDGVRYRDEDVKELGLTGGREARMGDADLDRVAYAPAHVSKGKAGTKSGPITTDANRKIEDEVKPDEKPVEPANDGDGDKPARRAR